MILQTGRQFGLARKDHLACGGSIPPISIEAQSIKGDVKPPLLLFNSALY